ncbi:COG1361 S-layer family protein [archaeon]
MDVRTLVVMLLVVGGALAASDISSVAVTAGEQVWTSNMLYHGAYPTTYPSLIQPGDEGVWIDVEMRNYHSMQFYDVSGVLEVVGPFEAVVAEAEIEKVAPKEYTHAFYQLNVDPDAKPGEYKMRHLLSYKYDSYDKDGNKDVIDVEFIRTISVNVYYSERIEIKEVTVEPYNVLPGADVELQVLLANTGSVTVNDVDVNYSIATDPTEINLLPITTTSRRIATIRPGEEVIVSFPLQALKTATVKPYKVEVDAKYTSGSTTNTESDEVAVEIRGKPEMRLAGVQVDKDIVYVASPFSISIQLENVGSGDAKSVKTVLIDGGMDGVLTSYVGTVEVDDTGSAIFDVRDYAPGRKKITALITFEDAYGNDFSESVEVEYFVTAVTADYTMVVVLVVVVAGIGFWYWRNKQKKKKIQSLVR